MRTCMHDAGWFGRQDVALTPQRKGSTQPSPPLKGKAKGASQCA